MVDVQAVRMVIGFIILAILVALVLRDITHRLDALEVKVKALLAPPPLLTPEPDRQAFEGFVANEEISDGGKMMMQGKCFTATSSGTTCRGCDVDPIRATLRIPTFDCMQLKHCFSESRKDGQNIIYKEGPIEFPKPPEE